MGVSGDSTWSTSLPVIGPYLEDSVTQPAGSRPASGRWPASGAEALPFFVGPLVQGRIAIDHGALPIDKTVVESGSFEAEPPENHGYCETWMDKTDHHHWQNGHPNGWEWYESFRAAVATFIGGMSIGEGMQHVVDTSDRVLADTKEEYDAWKVWIEALPPAS